MSRRDEANLLKNWAARYFSEKGFSSHFETGLCKRGRLRADVISVNYKGEIIVTEVKSCVQDFRTDSKFHRYLPYCNKLYFIFSNDTFQTLSKDDLASIKLNGAGVFIFDGLCVRNKVRAKRRPVEGKIRKNILLRLVWRTGINRKSVRRLGR